MFGTTHVGIRGSHGVLGATRIRTPWGLRAAVPKALHSNPWDLCTIRTHRRSSAWPPFWAIRSLLALNAPLHAGRKSVSYERLAAVAIAGLQESVGRTVRFHDSVALLFLFNFLFFCFFIRVMIMIMLMQCALRGGACA